MNKTLWITVVGLLTAVPLFADGTNNVLSNGRDRASYAIGLMIGRNLQQQMLDADANLIARAIKDVQNGGNLLMSPTEAVQAITAYQKGIGEAFLASNKNNPGVVTLPDGLEYRVITNGTGAMPAATDTVTVNYRGTLVNGTEFDSSAKHGRPASFQVNRVIHGWTEALLQMKTGSKWQLFIPSDLAYGPQGRPGIPGNSVLIFDVELLSVQSPPPVAPGPKPSSNQPLTSDIIKVPSAEELKKGAKIEVIKAEDVQKMQQQQTN